MYLVMMALLLITYVHQASRRELKCKSQMDENVIYFQQRLNFLNIKCTLQFNVKRKTMRKWEK